MFKIAPGDFVVRSHPCARASFKPSLAGLPLPSASTLMASGFVPTIPLPLNALTVLRMFDRLNREVDVFVRYYIPFEELLSASEMVCVSDNMVRVASLEHVIQAKRITRRPHDLHDIERLLSVAKPVRRDQETDEQDEEGE